MTKFNSAMTTSSFRMNPEMIKRHAEKPVWLYMQ